MEYSTEPGIDDTYYSSGNSGQDYDPVRDIYRNTSGANNNTTGNNNNIGPGNPVNLNPNINNPVHHTDRLAN